MIEFLAALSAIILIDVVLGGENALVIAMATRNLPKNLKRKALIYGTFGAVAIRFLCVATLSYLLMVPGLKLVGGIALIYIAYQLLKNKQEEQDTVSSASTFWGAMATIIWADTVMGLDNALGIAGAANGNWWLIIFGLLFSVPIILFGSTVVAKIIERWPRTIWIGTLVLTIVALQMIWNEPLIQELINESIKKKD